MRISALLLLTPAATWPASISTRRNCARARPRGAPSQIHLPLGMRVLDFDVSPADPRVALLAVDASGAEATTYPTRSVQSVLSTVSTVFSKGF